MTGLVHRELIFVGVQASQGAPVALGSCESVLVGGLGWSHEGARMNERDRVRRSKGRLPQVFGGTLVQITGNIELKGSGSAGTPPEFGAILRACGLLETIVASTSVTYTPVSDAQEFLTVYYFDDNGVQRVITDAKGNISFNAEVGAIGTGEFTITGHESGSPSDETIPAESYDDTTPPPFIAAGFTVGGYADAVIGSLTLDPANEIVTPPDANSADGYGTVRIARRDVQGSFNPEATSVATQTWVADWKSGVSKALDTGVIGATAGNQWQITCPAIKYREVGAGDRESVRIYEIAFGAAEDAGDDEFSLIFQ